MVTKALDMPQTSMNYNRSNWTHRNTHDIHVTDLILALCYMAELLLWEVLTKIVSSLCNDQRSVL